MRSSLNTSCLLPQNTGKLGASACGLCRTYCYRCVLKCDVSSTNVARRMSCCLVVNSSQSVMQCDACIRKELHAKYSAPAQVLEYSAPESVTCAVRIATATGGFGSLPIEFSVCTCTCRGVHRAKHIQCLRRATQVLEYLAPAPLTYAAPFATATGGINSLPVEPTVSYF